MRKVIGRLLLTTMGWKEEGELSPEPKAVMIAAPHTTNWDLPLMLALAYVYGIEIKWMGKQSIFKPPFGWLMKAWGGVPIVRSERRNTVQQMCDLFEASEGLILMVPAEGTRGRVEYWKSGFYRIAEGADVPIILGYLDYARKRGGFGPALRPTGDISADMDVIRAFYADKKGKYPEKFAQPLLREEQAPNAEQRA